MLSLQCKVEPVEGAAASIAVQAPAWIQQLRYPEQSKTSIAESVSQLQQELQAAADAKERLVVVKGLFQDMQKFDFADQSKLVQLLRIYAKLEGLKLLMHIPTEVPDGEIQMPKRPADRSNPTAQLRYKQDVKRARKLAIRLAQQRKRQQNARMLGDDSLVTWSDLLKKKVKEIVGDKSRKTIAMHANACEWYIAVAKQGTDLHRPVLPTAAAQLWECYKDLKDEETKLSLIKSVAGISGPVTCTAVKELLAAEQFRRPRRTAQTPSQVAKRAATLHVNQTQQYLKDANSKITQAEEEYQVASDKVLAAERLKHAATDPEQLKQAVRAAQASVARGQDMLAEARTAADKAADESLTATRVGGQSPGACKSLVDEAVSLAGGASAARRKAKRWQRKFKALGLRAAAVLQPAPAAAGEGGAAGGYGGAEQQEVKLDLNEDSATAAAAAARAGPARRGTKRQRREDSLTPAENLLQGLKRRCATPSDWCDFFGPQVSKRFVVQDADSLEPGSGSNQADGSISRQQHIKMLTRRVICSLYSYLPELTNVEDVLDVVQKMVLNILPHVQLSGAGSSGSSSDEMAIAEEADVCRDALNSLLKGRAEEASRKLAQSACSSSDVVTINFSSRLRYTMMVEIDSNSTGGSDEGQDASDDL